MNSVLVDFYNLHSQIKRLKETHIPMNEDERELLRFFENYAPHVVSKMTPEETRQIITSHILPIFSELLYITLPYSDDEESLQKVMAIINDEEFIQKVMPKTDLNSPLSHALTLFFTTLEGYKVIKRISWFESDDFDCFAEEHQHIKLLIEKYLDDGYFTLADFDWLKSRMNRMGTYWMAELFVQRARGNYKNLRIAAEDKEVLIRQFRCLKSNNPFEFGISFGELFPLIYNEAMLLLKGKLDIQRCKRNRNGCNNIFYANHKGRKYCSDKICRAKRSAESSKKSDNSSRDTIRKRIARAIDEWLEDKEQMTAGELMDEIPNIAKIMRNQKDPAKSLGTYLSGKLMTEPLREKGIELTVKKEGNKNLYCFERIAIP